MESIGRRLEGRAMGEANVFSLALRPPPSALCSGSCSRAGGRRALEWLPHQAAPPPGLPAPAWQLWQRHFLLCPPAQQWGACGFLCCDSLGCLTIPFGLLAFSSPCEICRIERPVTGCFSEWTFSNVDVLDLRCLMRRLNGDVYQQVLYRLKGAESGLRWRQT